MGHYAVQLAKWAGASVIATVSSPAKAARARAAGADLVVDYRQDDVAKAALDFTGGEGVDHVVDVDLGGNLAHSHGVPPGRRIDRLLRLAWRAGAAPGRRRP